MKRTVLSMAVALAACVGLAAPAAAAPDLKVPVTYVVPPQQRTEAKPPRVHIEPPACDDCVAITFDDGPSDETVRLLDILREKDVRASFFVIGTSAELRPGILRRMLFERHTIANHSLNHPPLTTLAEPGIANELDVTTGIIKDSVYWGPRWLRPPYGDMDARVASVAGSRKLALAMWDVDTNDWQHHNPATSCDIAVNQSVPGSIILLHDIHPESVDAVPCIIDGLRAKGLRPVSLDEMVPEVRPGMTYTNKFTPPA